MPRASRSCGSRKTARRGGSLGAKGGKHLERVAVGLHGVPRLLDASARPDKEGRADHALAAPRPLAPRAVRLVHFPVGIGEEANANPVLLTESLMRRGVVPRDAEDGNAEHLELGKVVRELACLGRAAWGVVLRIEVHDVARAFEVLGGNDFSLVV